MNDLVNSHFCIRSAKTKNVKLPFHLTILHQLTVTAKYINTSKQLLLTTRFQTAVGHYSS